MSQPLVPFTQDHLAPAVALFIEAYRQEQVASPLLPARAIQEPGWIRDELNSYLGNPAVAAGPHTLALDVTGNMRNMMGPHHVDGLPGAWTWNRSPHHQPPGAAYKTCPSGLLALPTLLR